MNKPQLEEPVHKETGRDRVVPIIPASVSWETFVTTDSGSSVSSQWAGNSRIRASRFSLD